MQLMWFRRDLRVVDNPALQSAVSTGTPVVALFVATPEQWRSHDMAPIQADLIFRRLSALKSELAKFNIPLLYQEVDDFSQATDFVAGLLEDENITGLYANREYELNEVNRDSALEKKLAQLGKKPHFFHDRCVKQPGSVLNKQGDYFKVFTPFKKAWLADFTLPSIKVPYEAPAFDLTPLLSSLIFESESACFSYPRIASDDWPVTFEEIRECLRLFCREKIEHYDEQRDFPIQDETSRLSPYLALGILSVRQCIARIYADSKDGRLSKGAEVWLSELVWREFYQHLIFFRPDLSKGNNFHSWADNLRWNDDQEWFGKWKTGQTGFPIVDAAMRQLNQTGWMHNRLRMIVASFLTKDLHISWRLGEAYFMSKLIDGDYPANNGGWQWCASTGCDGQPYFRIFNPTAQGERFDANGEFIRRWIPELKTVPNKYIHQPWTWSSVSNLSYPKPMVDHKEERAITLSIYKEAKDS